MTFFGLSFTVISRSPGCCVEAKKDPWGSTPRGPVPLHDSTASASRWLLLAESRRTALLGSVETTHPRKPAVSGSACRSPRFTAPVVNVSSCSAEWSMIFPLAYAAVLTCLLLQAFRMMRLSSASAARATRDRTGLRTIHPELLDENGAVTTEELWSVRFSDNEGVVVPEA